MPLKNRRSLLIDEGKMEIIDMLNNANDLMQLYQQMKTNPVQMLSKRFNLPQNVNDPNEILQHLLNTGQVTQSQINQAMSMRNNPIVQQLMKR